MKRFYNRTDCAVSYELSDVPPTSCKTPEFHWGLNDSGPQTSGVHPLVPLLIYSHRHFPPTSDPQPIRAQSDAQADAHSRTHPCHSSGNNNKYRPTGAIKKPLNAFMLYMKEMRHAVLQEGKERESAAINRILGHRWHALSHAEQSKYYELARKERLLHLQLYPGWSARDNYGKRKRKQSQRFCRETPSLRNHQLLEMTLNENLY